MVATAPALLAVDGDLWVLAKPAGYLVHQSGNRERPDLISWAVAELDAPATLAPIHRLDRMTSGVVLCSPDRALRSTLGRAFAERRVSKRYRALVYGCPPAQGLVDRELADGRRQGPLAAVTRFERLEHLGPASYLEVHPETGRKHQIRRHLNLIGHPIVGDRRYRPTRRSRVVRFPRLWLHALTVTLADGRSFEAPLAPELANHLEELRAIHAR